jgi:rhodanese-related sulfurtransferase
MIVMKTFAFFFSVALVFVTSSPAPAQFGGLFGSSPKVEEIGVEDVQSLLAEQEKAKATAAKAGKSAPEPDFVVVDVRSDEEVDVSIIPGAITKEEYEKNPSKYKGRTVIPYCTIGGRSGRYAAQLKKKGVDVKNFKGSILAWVRAELPLETLEGESTRRVHIYSDRYKIPSKYQAITK